MLPNTSLKSMGMLSGRVDGRLWVMQVNIFALQVVSPRLAATPVISSLDSKNEAAASHLKIKSCLWKMGNSSSDARPPRWGFLVTLSASWTCFADVLLMLSPILLPLQMLLKPQQDAVLPFSCCWVAICIFSMVSVLFIFCFCFVLRWVVIWPSPLSSVRQLHSHCKCAGSQGMP